MCDSIMHTSVGRDNTERMRKAGEAMLKKLVPEPLVERERPQKVIPNPAKVLNGLDIWG